MSTMEERAHLVLADGTVFPGEPFGGVQREENSSHEALVWITQGLEPA